MTFATTLFLLAYLSVFPCGMLIMQIIFELSVCIYPNFDYVPTKMEKLIFAYTRLNLYIFGPLATLYLLVYCALKILHVI